VHSLAISSDSVLPFDMCHLVPLMLLQLIKYLADVADWYTNEACFTFMGDCKLYEPVTKGGIP
jgi:hypothetical protein